MDIKELRERQSWSLNQKIDHAIGTIEQFLSRTDGKCYVGFSGGKDSTVLLDLCRMVKPDIKAVFCNTGNEYPDIVKFVRQTDNVEIIYPELKPKEVFANYGFPLVSKSSSAIIRKAKSNPDGKVYENFVVKRESLFSLPKKWMYLLETPYDVSEKCCDILKKKPFHKYQKETGMFPIIGEMASESMQREMKYLQVGSCNQFGAKINSKTLSIWTEKDIWDYIELKHLKIADIYYKGVKRTGCMFCGYGIQFKDDNRLKVVYDLYPKWYDKFMAYTNNGVTYKEAIRDVLKRNNLHLPDENPCLFDIDSI